MQYLVIASIIWAFSFGLIKVNLTMLDPNFVTFCRMAFALPLFLPFLSLSKIPSRQRLQLLSIGAIQYGIMYQCYLRAFQYLDAHQIALFSMLTPLYVVISDAAFQKKWAPFAVLTALISVLGGMVIYYKQVPVQAALLGFVLMQLANACFAFGQVAYKHIKMTMHDYRDVENYALLYLGALCIAGLSTTASHGWSSISHLTLASLMVLLYLGCFASGLCFFLWNKGAVTTHTGTLAVFNNLKGPLAILVAVVFFKEHADVWRLGIGLAIILMAMVLSEYRLSRVYSVS